MTTVLTPSDDSGNKGNGPPGFSGAYVAKSSGPERELLAGFDHNVALPAPVFDGDKFLYMQTPPNAAGSGNLQLPVVSPPAAVNAAPAAEIPVDDPDLADRLAWRAARKQAAVVAPPVPTSVASNEVDMGSHDIGLPFLGVPTPVKPRKTVVFRIPRLGTWSVRFHDVIVTSRAVILVYDGRYDQGLQFVPSFNDTVIDVTIGTSDGQISVKCVSLDISWSLGCLECSLLLITGDDADDGKERSDRPGDPGLLRGSL